MTQIIQTADLDPQRVQAFIEQLQMCKGPRIYATEYRSVFATCFPHRPRAAESRRWLLAALQYAATIDVIRLPVAHGTSWERDLQPALPMYVTCVRAASTRHTAWQHFPWHPQLAWVATLNSLPSDQEQFLHRVHIGLVRGEFLRSAPLKYRSLTLTGDEKALGLFAKSALFRHDRLSFALLGCIPDFPPLVLERLNNQPKAIVFENVGSFRVACEVLGALADPPYGIVGFGGGAGFKRSVFSFGQLRQPPNRIDYVGDLDRPGLDIASYATQVAQRESLPPISAAADVHRAMIKSAHQLGYPLGMLYPRGDTSSTRDPQLTAWLSQDIRTHIQAVLQEGRRIPEEVLGPEELGNLWD